VDPASLKVLIELQHSSIGVCAQVGSKPRILVVLGRRKLASRNISGQKWRDGQERVLTTMPSRDVRLNP
jgi:hypothetical protein